jgi:hypothetical protein
MLDLVQFISDGVMDHEDGTADNVQSNHVLVDNDSSNDLGAVGGVESLKDSIIYVGTYLADIEIGNKKGNTIFL